MADNRQVDDHNNTGEQTHGEHGEHGEHGKHGKHRGGKSRRSPRRKSRKGRKSRKAKRRTAKVGSKSNPYKNKTACMKGRRSGKVFFKRKGRVVSMKKKK